MGWDAEAAWYQDGKLVWRGTQDVEPILDHNKRLMTSGDGYSPDRTLRRAASIPNAVVVQWLAEGVDVRKREHWPEVRKRLNSPEWRHLRTAPGVL